MQHSAVVYLVPEHETHTRTHATRVGESSSTRLTRRHSLYHPSSFLNIGPLFTQQLTHFCVTNHCSFMHCGAPSLCKIHKGCNKLCVRLNQHGTHKQRSLTCLSRPVSLMPRSKSKMTCAKLETETALIKSAPSCGFPCLVIEAARRRSRASIVHFWTHT